ncbi:MAG TPA: DUF721 domain-containing protein [Spirochaetia bacterium]|nr:DUF721 domain-containing protein [Spirochaetia bacterium]
MDDSRIKDAGALLSAFFDEEKLRRGGLYADFFTSWKYLVGDRLAAHSRVADVDKGVLIVEAEHPGWIQLLQFRQSEILAGVAARFPELALRSVVFRLGKGKGLPGGSAEGGSGAAAPRPGPFGPEGRDLIAAELAAEAAREAEAAGPAPQGGSDAAGRNGEAGAETAPPSLEDIADPGLRELLSGLKSAIEGGRLADRPGGQGLSADEPAS